MTYEFFAQTDRGRVRANNEDAVAVDREAQVAVLADGMGGYNAGEIASGMAIAYIGTEMSRWLAQAGTTPPATDVWRALELCVENANHAILGASLSNPQYSGMGTTLVVGVFQCDRLILGHIGDSRCYRLRRGVAANHARPFLVAGTGRCRHIDPGAGSRVVQPQFGYPRVGCGAACANGSERISSGAQRPVCDVL